MLKVNLKSAAQNQSKGKFPLGKLIGVHICLQSQMSISVLVVRLLSASLDKREMSEAETRSPCTQRVWLVAFALAVSTYVYRSP